MKTAYSAKQMKSLFSVDFSLPLSRMLFEMISTILSCITLFIWQKQTCYDRGKEKNNISRNLFFEIPAGLWKHHLTHNSSIAVK